jgi:hypothetical protein
MIFQKIFSGFYYLAAFSWAQFGGQKLGVSVGKGLYFGKNQQIALFQDYVDLAGAYSKVAFYYRIALLGVKSRGGVFPRLSQGLCVGRIPHPD